MVTVCDGGKEMFTKSRARHSQRKLTLRKYLRIKII